MKSIALFSDICKGTSIIKDFQDKWKLKKMILHIKIWLPAVVNFPREVFYERNMRRSLGFREKFHFSLFGSSVPFFIIALDTSGNEIIPGIFTTFWFRDNVVNGEVLWSSAILTPVTVSPEDILSWQDYFFKRDTNKEGKLDDARTFKFPVNWSDDLTVHCVHNFSFTEIVQDDCSFNITNSQWFVILIENQNFSVKQSLRGWYIIFVLIIVENFTSWINLFYLTELIFNVNINGFRKIQVRINLQYT